MQYEVTLNLFSVPSFVCPYSHHLVGCVCVDERVLVTFYTRKSTSPVLPRSNLLRCVALLFWVVRMPLASPESAIIVVDNFVVSGVAKIS